MPRPPVARARPPRRARWLPLVGAVAALLPACRATAPDPSLILDPHLSERDLRHLLGVPDGADRVLVLSQSSHLDIDWKQTFDGYYGGFVESIFDQAGELLAADRESFYSLAETAYLARYLDEHDAGAWRAQAARGHLRVVGGGMTSPDTLLPTAEPLIRDYLAGSRFAEEALGARPRAAWLPDSFGHSATVPDLLSAAGFDFVGLGRIDGARHSYEIMVGNLPPIAPGVDTTASLLHDLGSADFVWRGPGGGELLAHYMPVREYCQGDTIDLSGYALGGQRIGVERGDEPGYVEGQIADYISALTPYEHTPYLFVPVGCDFQAPRPLLTTYARWWNQSRFSSTGVWVVAATFEDYMRLVAFHRDALPVLARDLAPVWTGFYASRPSLKQAARAAAESLAGVEPFLALADPASTRLADAWQSVVLSDHHDWITGTANDDVAHGEQLPRLQAALATAESAWGDVVAALTAKVDTDAAAGDAIVVFNAAPVDRSGVVEVPHAGAGAWHAVADDGSVWPAQAAAPDRIAFVAGTVPAFGWRTFSLAPGDPSAAAPAATATLDGDSASLHTGALDARFGRHAGGWSLDSLAVRGQELLSGPSLEWVVYSDTGGLYRIGSERPDCAGAAFSEVATVPLAALALVEAGPARVALRASATVDGIATTIDIIAAAGDDHLTLRITGAAAPRRTIMLRVRPSAPGDTLAMGVAGGAAVRPLRHLYSPSLWPAVTWVASGRLAVALAQATAVAGDADGALAWTLFRNATTEKPCDDLGPSGSEDGTLTEQFSLGARDPASAGAAELASSLLLTRPLRPQPTDRHAGALPAVGRLISIDAPSAIATALKPASRGAGLVLHLVKLGAEPARVSLRPGLLQWRSISRPDLLERDDVPITPRAPRGASVVIDAALTALRLVP